MSSLGLRFADADLEYYEYALEEGIYLEEEINEIAKYADGRPPYEEQMKEYLAELDDINMVKMMAFESRDPKVDHKPEWSRLKYGPIYKDGYFEEKMFRTGEWKDYHFGGKHRKKMPPGDLPGLGHGARTPQWDFVKAQKLPQEAADRHLRYMRRFNHFSKDINCLVPQRGSKDEGSQKKKKKRRGKNDLPELHPRVEEALSLMFEDMSRTRALTFNQEDEY